MSSAVATNEQQAPEQVAQSTALPVAQDEEAGIINRSKKLQQPEEELTQTKPKESLLDKVLDDPLSKFNEALRQAINEAECQRLKNGRIRLPLQGEVGAVEFSTKDDVESILVKPSSPISGFMNKGITQEAADIGMKLAANRGWTEVEITGSLREREILWLAAKMNGLSVVKFEPHPESNVARQYKAIQEEEKRKKEAAANDPVLPKEEVAKPVEAAAPEAKADAPKAAEPPKAEQLQAEAPKAAEPPKAVAPKTFGQWIEQAARETPSKVERDGLNKLGEGLGSGKIKMDGLEENLFKAKHGAEGYNSAMKLAQGIADKSKSGITFPMAAETYDGSKPLPSALEAANKRYPATKGP